MSAATSDISTNTRAGEVLTIPMAAETLIYEGTLVAVDSSGNANPASDTAGLVVVGRAEFHADNSAGIAGAFNIKVRRGVFGYANDTTHPLSAADIGQSVAFVLDDQTVTRSGTTHSIKAGLVVGYDPETNIVWIDTRRADSLAGNVTLTQDSITDDTTGTAPAPSGGVLTLAAITSTATAANAISGLAAELNKVKADLATLKALL